MNRAVVPFPRTANEALVRRIEELRAERDHALDELDETDRLVAKLASGRRELVWWARLTWGTLGFIAGLMAGAM